MGIINAKVIFLAIALVVLLQFIQEDSDKFDSSIMIPPNTKVVAFGDSITNGYGVDKDKTYPAQLSELLGVEVINAGINGEMSSAGLKRLPSIVEKYSPDILIICHGGNDILRKQNLLKAKENIAQMIKLAKSKNIHVILVGVPAVEVLNLSTAQFYKELSSEYDVALEDSALESILNDSTLKTDQVHPNEKGYELLANKIAQILSITYIPKF